MTEADVIAERWGATHGWNALEALVAAHRRVVELEAALVDLADADHPCTIQQALMDAGLVPEDGYCNCDDCTAYLRHKASRPPDTSGAQ